MRLREFWQLVDEVLGNAHGRELARELVLRGLDQRTAMQALDDNVEPRTVWHALCDELEIPDSARWGADARRPAPPRA
ncbi:DUF3046 domain-containing protein [Cellulomonas sp. ICMP 17802]|uniref:DUF3046 domain-containing protein n=1 Tax=Cellulomonas sp. ICMP 17802 TaxID=3239199 RepID=UPI00351B90CE